MPIDDEGKIQPPEPQTQPERYNPLGMGFSGALRGITYGTVAALVLIACFSGLGSIGIPVALACMGTGAAIFSVRDAKKGREEFEKEHQPKTPPHKKEAGKIINSPVQEEEQALDTPPPDRGLRIGYGPHSHRELEREGRRREHHGRDRDGPEL